MCAAVDALDSQVERESQCVTYYSLLKYVPDCESRIVLERIKRIVRAWEESWNHSFQDTIQVLRSNYDQPSLSIRLV